MRTAFTSGSLALLVTLALAGATTAARAQDLTNTGTQLTVQPGVLLAVPGALVNQAGATLTTGGTVQVGGDFTNAGTVVPASGTVVFTGTADQTLTPGGATLANVEVRNTGPAGANRVLLPADLIISQQLTLTGGMLRTAPAAALRLASGAGLTGETSGRYVQGNLEIARANVQGTTPVDFGNGVLLNPNGNTLGTVHVTRAAGLQLAGVSYGQNPANSAQKGIDRVWTIAAEQAPTTPADLTFSWLADDDNGLTDFRQAQVWRMPDNGTAWEPVGPRAEASARSIAASTAAFSRWTVSSAANPLPVTLVAFTAEAQGTDALLRWTTASELRNDRFELESSADGRTFQRLGQVAGHGTTTLVSSYQWLDRNLARYAGDVVYYRLRQVDADGTSAYSPVRTVRVASPATFLAQAYPNPSNPAEAVMLLVRTPTASPTTWELFDAVGRSLVRTTADLPAGSTTLPLPRLADLATGVYVLQVRQGGQYQTIKLVRH